MIIAVWKIQDDYIFFEEEDVHKLSYSLYTVWLHCVFFLSDDVLWKEVDYQLSVPFCVMITRLSLVHIGLSQAGDVVVLTQRTRALPFCSIATHCHLAFTLFHVVCNKKKHMYSYIITALYIYNINHNLLKKVNASYCSCNRMQPDMLG